MNSYLESKAGFGRLVIGRYEQATTAPDTNAKTYWTINSKALLTFYFGAILHSRKPGLILGAGLSVLYVSLYVILQAEESALMMRSLLLFIVLAGLMPATRHFDWYELTGQGDASAKM